MAQNRLSQIQIVDHQKNPPFPNQRTNASTFAAAQSNHETAIPMDPHISSTRWWERQSVFRWLTIFCFALVLILVILVGISIILSHNTNTNVIPIKSTTKEVGQLFEEDSSPPKEPGQKPQKVTGKNIESLYTQRSMDTTFRMMDGILFDENNSAIRIFELGEDVADMDMLSLVLFTCCCNDKLIVVCDNSRPAGKVSSALLAPPEGTSISLDDYAVSCYLSHDPSTPFANSENVKYKHKWKLIIQFGRAFERAGSSSTDCIFSATYYTSFRPPPPPPIVPNNDLTQKIW